MNSFILCALGFVQLHHDNNTPFHLSFDSVLAKVSNVALSVKWCRRSAIYTPYGSKITKLKLNPKSNIGLQISQRVIATSIRDSFIWGLLEWTTMTTYTEERALGEKTIKTLQNFFRNKALEGFYKEGVIDSINYVQSLDEIPDDK